MSDLDLKAGETVEIKQKDAIVGLFKVARTMAIEAGELIPVTNLMKKVRPEILEFASFIDLTKNLFKALFPTSQDAAKDILWEMRLEDLYKGFMHTRDQTLGMMLQKKSVQLFQEGKSLPTLEFDLKIQTVVKRQTSETEYETYSMSGKSDGTLRIYVQPFFDENLKKGFIFGLMEETKK